MVAVEVPVRAAIDSKRAARTYPTDGTREPRVGSRAHRERIAAEARSSSLAAHGGKVVSGFIVRRDHRRRPGPTFYQQHRKRSTNDAWWFGELREFVAYPWRKLRD